uniref:Uncharacterized protein n=1 Tax=Romanomermis culicivorax TaxID=13658 RepID=A0A915J028_ROMCU
MKETKKKYNKCQKCYVELLSIRNFVQTTMKNERNTSSRDKISMIAGGQQFTMASHLQREICLLLQQVVES